MKVSIFMNTPQEKADNAIHRELEVASKGSNLAKVRAFIEKLAVDCGFNDSEVFETKVAVGEACANAIEHGSPQGKVSHVNIVCEYADKCLEIEVVDQGVFKPRFPAFDSQLNYRGRGIPFMLALMDEVEIKESEEGTTVRLVKCRA
jgi:anti-sigma regulatory factor (Ser/Thr protein kinase)